jgi:hypothetical protein
MLYRALLMALLLGTLSACGPAGMPPATESPAAAADKDKEERNRQMWEDAEIPGQ